MMQTEARRLMGAVQGWTSDFLRAATDLLRPRWQPSLGLRHDNTVKLGREFGGRDHTTVISGVRRIERLVTERPELRKKLRAIEAWVQQPPAEQEVPG